MTYPEPISRLYDLQRLATVPEAGERSGNSTSFDRNSQYDPATDTYIDWGAISRPARATRTGIVNGHSLRKSRNGADNVGFWAFADKRCQGYIIRVIQLEDCCQKFVEQHCYVTESVS
jgi:hypothetical protein